MIRTIPLFAAFLALTGAAAPVQTSCDIMGWGAARQTVVRAAPSPNGRVLAVMRHRAARERGQDVGGTYPEFHINAARGGWFRIDSVSYGDYGDPAPLRPVFSGQGWVRGDQIGGQLMAGRFYTAPSQNARSRPYGKEQDIVRIRRLLDCRGSWVKIDADIGTGWIQGLCNNQVTTCA